MKLFLDTADVEEIRNVYDTGLLDGVTTNPAKIVQTGRKFGEVVREICGIVPGPVSAEAVADSTEDIVAKGESIASIAPNVVVKVPMTVEGLKAAEILEKEKKVRVNITMIFSSTQAFLAMKTGAYLVSIVLSRLDAVANESEALIRDAVAVKKNYGYQSLVLAASLKTQNHVLECLRAGVDAVTIPSTLFYQMYRHPLTDLGLQEFDEAWRRGGEK